VSRVEELIQKDVEVYITEVARESSARGKLVRLAFIVSVRVRIAVALALP
jgi:hypothetical protein